MKKPGLRQQLDFCQQ